MKTSYIFLAPGFEEIEAVTPVDMLRRADMPVETVSITPGNPAVVGAHGVTYIADLTIDQLPLIPDAEWLVLPGGMPGATNLHDCAPLAEMLQQFQGNIAAICASPAVVLGQLGLLRGVRATCYPGMEQYAVGANLTNKKVEHDGRFVTAQGPACSMLFAAEIIRTSKGASTAADVLNGMLAIE